MHGRLEHLYAFPVPDCNFCTRTYLYRRTMCFPLHYNSANQPIWPVELKKRTLLNTQGPQRITVNHSVEHTCATPTRPQPPHIINDPERIWMWDLDLLQYRYISVKDITSFWPSSTIFVNQVDGGLPM